MSKITHPEPTESIQSAKVAKRLSWQSIHLISQSKNVIMNVRKFFEEEKGTEKSKLRERDSDSNRNI